MFASGIFTVILSLLPTELYKITEEHGNYSIFLCFTDKNNFFFVPCLDNGFLGTYDPPADFLEDILNRNRKDGNSSSPTLAPSSRKRRSLLAVSTSGNSLSGISNPTTCVDFGASMIFVVDNDNYPEYDENNLYNTNPDFDSGPFRDLKERHTLMNTNSTLFAFKFDSPGVYVFRSSKFPDYKMVGFIA